MDFGTSDFIQNDQRIKTCAGTYYFMAPEILNVKKGGSYCPFIADIWSLGITMYSFAYFKVPFIGKNLVELFENVLS